MIKKFNYDKLQDKALDKIDKLHEYTHVLDNALEKAKYEGNRSEFLKMVRDAYEIWISALYRFSMAEKDDCDYCLKIVKCSELYCKKIERLVKCPPHIACKCTCGRPGSCC